MVKNDAQPSYQILICLIKIWTPEDKTKPMETPNNTMLISEVERIEIEETYKKLIGTASVSFPRGTVVHKTIDKLNKDDVAESSTLIADIADTGVVEEFRSTSEVATTGNFSVGQRIRIYLGYTEDPVLAASAKLSGSGKTIFNDQETLSKYQKAMDIMFDGYITKISVDSPIELQCENLASALKSISCPKVTIKSKATVLDFLGEKAKHPLLKNTGLKLHPKSKTRRFDLGKVTLTPELSVADVLTEWSKIGLHCFVTECNGEAVIAVGATYFDNAKDDSIVNLIEQASTPTQILFDYNVANNGLSLTSTDKKFLAIEAQGVAADDKFIRFTLLRSPDYDPSDEKSEKWRVVNGSNLSKKAMKRGARTNTKTKNKLDMSLYSQFPYMSRKIPVTESELLEEAKKYFESFNMTGIDGTLTLFGDLHLRTGTKVELVDKRYPGKNGYYLVEEVNTTFGVNGYRQQIKLPYCIKRNKQENQKK